MSNGKYLDTDNSEDLITSALKPDAIICPESQYHTCQSTYRNISESLTLHENYITNKLILNLKGEGKKLF